MSLSHSAHARAAVVFDDVTFAWPDGEPVLDRVTAAFGPGRTGLVGNNGAGKTTLLRLIRGELTPTSGRIAVAGDVAHLPQHVTLADGQAVADLLGIAGILHALRAVEAGDVAEEHFDAIGEDWDVETRAQELLDAAGLGGLELDRPVERMSGGQVMLLAVAGLRLRRAPVTLLDEPTNNLDRDHRARLRAMLADWPGALLVVSHDIGLLEDMEETADLRDGRLTVVGGGWSTWVEHSEREQQAARRALSDAEKELRAETRRRAEAETRLARASRKGKADADARRYPRIVAGNRKAQAQANAGRVRVESDRRLADARATVRDRAERVVEDGAIRIQLPDPGVPASRRLAELSDGERTVILQGPERTALTGPNGVGKTRLLEALVHGVGVPEGTGGAASAGWGSPGDPVSVGIGDLTARALTERIGYLPQRIDTLDPAASVLDTVRAAAPGVGEGDLRAGLARFLLRGRDVLRPVGELSGGERFRVAMARLLLADPPAQLLVLDEPTNSLDVSSVSQLVGALSDYRGGLLVVSHDETFLRGLGVTRRLALEPPGRLAEVDPRSAGE